MVTFVDGFFLLFFVSRWNGHVAYFYCLFALGFIFDEISANFLSFFFEIVSFGASFFDGCFQTGIFSMGGEGDGQVVLPVFWLNFDNIGHDCRFAKDNDKKGGQK